MKPHLDLPERLPPGAHDPTCHHGTFGTLPILLAPRIRFPREAMQPALDVHARMLRRYEHELLHAFLDPDAAAHFDPFDGMEAWAPVLVEHDDRRVSLQLLRRQQSSWIVRRCRGIVHELMESPGQGRGFVVLVARGVAALHRVMGTGDEGRDWESDTPYTYEGLGLKPVGPPIAPEPWEQWHLRRGSRMTTYWRLPDGSSGQDDVEIPAEPRTVHERVERTVAFHQESIARAHEKFVRRNGRGGCLLYVNNTKRRGFHVWAVPHAVGFVESFVRGHPTIRRLALRGAKGFDPVYVKVEYGAGLRWVRRGRAEDRQVPRGVDERDEGGGE